MFPLCFDGASFDKYLVALIYKPTANYFETPFLFTTFFCGLLLQGSEKKQQRSTSHSKNNRAYHG